LPTEYAQQAAFELGADIQHHLSSPLTKERIKMADLILVMQVKHLTAVIELVPEAKKKTYIITDYVNKNKTGIADPIGQSLQKYQETAKLLYNLLKKVYKKIIIK
jgi:protein-tyrosine phosphatase